MLEIHPDEFDVLTRFDFATFIERVFAELNAGTPYLDNFHIHLLAGELEAMRRGDVKRLMVNLHPRTMKSLIVSVAYPAWLLGHDPTSKIISVSYGQELANALARQCRQVMQSGWYRKLFSKTRLSAIKTDNIETTAGGFRMATSVGGVITGMGGDYLLLDDPMKPQEALSEAERNSGNEWYRHTLISRLNDKRHGRIAMVTQRIHQDDMSGFVLGLESWRIISLPAIAIENELHVIRSAFGTWVHRRKEGEALHPEREPLEILENYRRQHGPEHFAAQYLQAPVLPGGNMIKIDQLRRYDWRDQPVFTKVIQSWDTAYKSTQLSGFSVCTTWGIVNERIYLLDVVRGRFDYHDLREKAVHLARSNRDWGRRPDWVVIEDKASGQSLIQDMKRAGILNIVAVRPDSDKQTRMHTQTGLIADGRVFVPRDAAWLDVFLQELMAFPVGKYDDQVDSTSQALRFFGEGLNQPGIITYYERLVRARAAGIPMAPDRCNG